MSKSIKNLLLLGLVVTLCLAPTVSWAQSEEENEEEELIQARPNPMEHSVRGSKGMMHRPTFYPGFGMFNRKQRQALKAGKTINVRVRKAGQTGAASRPLYAKGKTARPDPGCSSPTNQHWRHHRSQVFAGTRK